MFVALLVHTGLDDGDKHPPLIVCYYVMRARVPAP